MDRHNLPLIQDDNQSRWWNTLYWTPQDVSVLVSQGGGGGTDQGRWGARGYLCQNQRTGTFHCHTRCAFLSEPPLSVLTSDVALERCDIERMRKKTLQVKRRMTETVGDGDLLSSCLTPTTVDMFLANSNLWEKYKTSWMLLHSLMICLLTQILWGYFSALTTYLAYFQCLSTFELKVFQFRKFQFMLQFPISSDRFCCRVTVLPVRLWLLLPSINFCRNVFYNKNTKFSGLPGKL